MKLLSALVVSMLAVGVYSNCGCLKCSKHLNVYQPRGSGVKIIYKNQPCSCLSAVPYSVEVPVQQAPSNTRCYGYQVQQGPVEQAVPCPVPQAYNVQLQVPQNPQPSYLVGLVAKTDRVLLSGCAEPQPAPGGQTPIIESLPAAQESDSSDANQFWYYPPNQPQPVPSCGCFRYDRKVPKCRHAQMQSRSAAPPINLQLLLLHFYTPPKSYPKRDFNSVKLIRHPQRERFRRISVAQILRRPSADSEVAENEDLRSAGRLKSARRVYRKVFWKPWPKNSNSNRSFAYQQVFFRPQPKVLLVRGEADRKDVEDSDQRHSQIQNRILIPIPNQQGNAEDVGKTLRSRTRVDDFGSKSLPSTNYISKQFLNLISTKPSLGKMGKNINVSSKMGLEKSFLQDCESKVQNQENLQNIAQIPDNGRTGVENFDTQRKSVPLQMKTVSGRPEKFTNVLENSELNPETPPSNSPFTYKNVPRSFHLITSQRLLLSKDDSGPKKILLSTTHQFRAISDSPVAETMDSVLSKNRPKRSINWRLLALKPENPPRHLRMQNVGSSHRNEGPKSKAPLKGRFRGGQPQEDNYYRPAVHGTHPSFPGYGRHSTYNTFNGRPVSSYGGSHLNHNLYSVRNTGRHSILGRKPVDPHRSARIPRDNKKKKKGQLKKKKSNVMLKSTLKRTNKIIKDWFSKASPLAPPEVQLPNFDSSNRKSLPFPKLNRHKRRVRDEGILPYFSFPEEKKERKRLGRKSAREEKHVQKVENANPTEAFLEPLNFDHILHPTPLLHLLNTPIRCLNHLHKLGSHVKPVVGTIPKVVTVSKKYVVGLLKNFGKGAIHLGTHFLKKFTNLKKSKLLPKRRRHKRSPDSSEDQWKSGEVKDWSGIVGGNKGSPDSSEDQWKAGEVTDLSSIVGGNKRSPDSTEDQWKAGEAKNWRNVGGGSDKPQIAPGGLEHHGDFEKTQNEGLESKNVEKLYGTIDQLMQHKELREAFAKLVGDFQHSGGGQVARIASLIGRRRKRDVNEDQPSTNEFLATFLKLLMGLGTPPQNEQVENYGALDEGRDCGQSSRKKQLNEDDQSREISARNEGEGIKLEERRDSTHSSEVGQSTNLRKEGGGIKQQKGDIGKHEEILNKFDPIVGTNPDNKDFSGPPQDISRDDISSEEEENTNEAANDLNLETSEGSDDDKEGSINIWKKVVQFSNGDMEVVDEDLDVSLNNPQSSVELEETLEDSRIKRNANQHSNHNMEEKIGHKMQVSSVNQRARNILVRPTAKPSHSTELDVQSQTIKNKISQILLNTQTLTNYDFSKHLDVYKGLIKLQDLKLEIIEKWKAIVVDKNLESVVANKNELLVELKEAQDLKNVIFQEIVQRLSDHKCQLKGNWINTLVTLQKLQCAAKKLAEKVKDGNFNIGILEELNFASSSNQMEILENLKREQSDKINAQKKLVDDMKAILGRNDGEKIKDAAKVIWEINNVEKLQAVSILELSHKLPQGLKVRKELKILFDLQKQLEKCEQKQMALGEKV